MIGDFQFLLTDLFRCAIALLLLVRCSWFSSDREINSKVLRHYHLGPTPRNIVHAATKFSRDRCNFSQLPIARNKTLFFPLQVLIDENGTVPISGLTLGRHPGDPESPMCCTPLSQRISVHDASVILQHGHQSRRPPQREGGERNRP